MSGGPGELFARAGRVFRASAREITRFASDVFDSFGNFSGDAFEVSLLFAQLFGRVGIEAVIVGGTLKTPTSSVILAIDRGSLLDGLTSTVNNQGTVDVNNNEYLTIDGTINNTDAIGLQSIGKHSHQPY